MKVANRTIKFILKSASVGNFLLIFVMFQPNNTTQIQIHLRASRPKNQDFIQAFGTGE